MSDNQILAAIIAVVVLITAFICEELITCAYATPSPMQGAVVDRAYDAARTSVGVSSGPKGTAHTTTTFHPERYTVFVQCDGGAVKVTTDLDHWTHCEKGTLVDLERRQSWTGITTDYRIRP